MELISSAHWTDYELIDTGNREKLERFGPWILARPEPQAVWQKSMAEAEWEKLAHARYERIRGKQQGSAEGDRGHWTRKPKMPDQWTIRYAYKGLDLKFRLGLTAFGHIGVFPEQAVNWDFVFDAITQKAKGKRQKSLTPDNLPRVLNLFAYTGGASLASRAAGADTVHVDSVKPVLTWAREIMEASGLDGIRWVAEDALTFVRREVKRGSRYDGIILDPPAYGRGPAGEKWVLEESVNELIAGCSRLLTDDGFFVLSLYSMGFSALIAENLVKTHFTEVRGLSSGEFYFTDRAGRRLPLGTFLRFGGE